MNLKIITTKKIFLEKEVDSVTMPGKVGQLTVLDGHDRLITELEKGSLYFQYLDKDDKLKREDYIIDGGFVEILKESCEIYVKTSIIPA